MKKGANPSLLIISYFRKILIAAHSSILIEKIINV